MMNPINLVNLCRDQSIPVGIEFRYNYMFLEVSLNPQLQVSRYYVCIVHCVRVCVYVLIPDFIQNGSNT